MVGIEFRPAGRVPDDQSGQHVDVGWSVVQGRDIAIVFATGRQKHRPVLKGDFFQRFQAVGGETGADHIHAFDPGSRPSGQQLAGVGLQPFGAAKARLKRHRPLILLQAQPFGDQPGGFVALAVVGVASQQVAFGQAVEGEQQPFAGLFGAGGADAGGQRVQIGGIVVIVGDQPQVRQPAPAPQFGGDRVEGRGDRGGGVLRVQRQHQQPARAGVP